MNSERSEQAKDKKKIALMTLVAVVALAAILIGGFVVLSKIKKDDVASAVASQEQFVGQAETSQQLQSECQISADAIVKSEDLQKSLNEFKKHAENCREVYFSVESKQGFRNEGMYPDLSIDLLVKLTAVDKSKSFEFLEYLKKFPPWLMYSGPVSCDSKSVVAAYEEQVKNLEDRVCIKPEEFEEKVYSELKNKNFAVLEKTLSGAEVAWLGLPATDVGCPDKISNIVKTVKSSAANAEIRPPEPKQESTGLLVIFRNGEEDKVVLEFGDSNGCFQLKSAAVAGLQVNE